MNKNNKILFGLAIAGTMMFACTLGSLMTDEATIPTFTPISTTTVEPTVRPTIELTNTPAITLTQLPDGYLSSTFGSIDIIGTQDFIDQTVQAFSLLKDKAPKAYHKVETYVSVIQLGDHSGMWAYEDRPRYEVGVDTASYSTTWYASTIAHDATHSELYHQYSVHKGEPVPDDKWIGVEAEQFCIAYQLEILKQVGGSADEINYLATQAGTHCDLDNDGDCDWEDYNNRNW